MRKRGYLVPILLTAGLGLSACSSPAASGGSSVGGSSSSTGATTSEQLSAAKAAVSAARAPVAFDAPGSGPKAIGRGRHFMSLECAASAGGCARLAEADKDAGAALGWRVDIVDGKGDASVYNTALQQAVAEKVDGIFLDAVDSKSIGDALAKAHAAGIPVVSQAAGNPVGNAANQVFAEINSPNLKNGNSMGDWIIDDSGGKAKVWMFHDPEFGGASQRYKGSKVTLQTDCRGCTILGDTSYQAATATTDLVAKTQAVLAAHPDIQYVWSDIDGYALLEAQAIRQGGKQASIKLVGFDCNPANLALIKGKDVEVACQGLGIEQAGWSAVDQMLRAISKEPAGPQQIPTRLIDASNLPPSGTYEGDTDFRAAYKKLWQVS